MLIPHKGAFMNTTEFEAKVVAFLQHLKIERNLSPNTIKSYQGDLKLFVDFWRSQPQDAPHDSVRRMIERYLMSLFYKKINKSSIARKFSCFKSFERYLKNFEITLNLQLTRPRLDKKLPVYLSTKEMNYLLDAIADIDLPTPFPVRDKAILELLYATGVRCAELINIKLADINFEEKTIRILGKGKRERMVLFGQKAKDQLIRYISLERPAQKNSDEYLFLNYRGGSMTSRSIQRAIAMFREFLQIKRPITPHKIRHSFATHLLHQGADLRVVQELLGHQNLASTEKYTHVTIEQLKTMCRTLHPINDINSDDNS